LSGARPARINKEEPQPDDGKPVCPPEASEQVKEIWDYTLRQLVTMGLATPTDRDALWAYCTAVAVHRRASAELANTPVVLPSHRGTTVRNPAFAIQRDAANQIRAYAHEFGLTPSARSGIRTGSAKPAAENASPDRYLTG
jgi:P27 family predicted phage terminase small subunit